MPKSQSKRLASTKRLAQINDLTSSLGRVASGLRQKSYQLSSTSLQDTGSSKLKRKAIEDGVEPPAKKRTLAQRDDLPLRKVRISSNVFL